jgi:hypothetical protein
VNAESTSQILQDPDHQRLKAVENFWNVLVRIYRGKGLDIPARIQAWIAACREELRQTGADFEFESLRRDGCSPLVLCCCFRAFTLFPIFSQIWQEIMGDRRQRERHIRELNNTADLIQSFFRGVGLDPEREKRVWHDEDPLPPPPSRMVNGLRAYGEIVGFFDGISGKTSVRTPRDVPRFVLTEYVFLQTGTWHDREVSALLHATDPDSTADENSQKSWRARNYDKLKRHYGQPVMLMRGVSVVIGL